MRDLTKDEIAKLSLNELRLLANEVEQEIHSRREEGRRWLASSDASAPLHWRRDGAGQWYGIGLNGSGDLQGDHPVAGINHHEATAFSAWSASLGGELRGTVLQHEYQWEVAARSGLLEEIGKVWEWCANGFHPYPEFAPFPDRTTSQDHFGGDRISLRGAGLHTQRCLRRASFRHWARAHSRHLFFDSKKSLSNKVGTFF